MLAVLAALPSRARSRISRLGCALAVLPMALGLLPLARVQAGEGTWLHLFHVGHDESPNVVQYDLVVDAQCRPLGVEPVKVYWRLTREKPSTRALTVIERRAYGVRAQARTRDGVRFHVAARPQQTAQARAVMRDGKCDAEVWTSVNGKKAILERAWIRTAEREWWRLPDVLHVDIFARLAGGESIFERVVP